MRKKANTLGKAFRQRICPGGPQRRWLRGDDPLSGELKYHVPVDWSRYESRVEALLELHDKDWVRGLLGSAEFLYSAPAVLVAQWAANGYEPADKTLAHMLSVLRRAMEEKKQEVGEHFTWVDFVDEYLVMTPRIDVSYNWAPYDAEERKKIHAREGVGAFKACTTTEVPSNLEPALPEGVPAFVTIRVPISPMKKNWGFGEVLKEIGNVLHDALENCPSREEAPMMRGTIPPQREFLLNAREEGLQRDITRHKLHWQQGLNFRQIAYMEDREDRGLSISVENIPAHIGLEMPGENAVCESVRRIYEAIHLQPMPAARRRRIDDPGGGIQEYACEEHGHDCPAECSYLKTWYQAVNRTLPSDFTGSLRGQVMLKEEHGNRELMTLRDRDGVWRQHRGTPEDFGIGIRDDSSRQQTEGEPVDLVANEREDKDAVLLGTDELTEAPELEEDGDLCRDIARLKHGEILSLDVDEDIDE